MNAFDELIATFRSEAADFLSEMAAILEAQRLSSGDREVFVAVRSIAHNLKGASLTVGARRIVDLCRTIETELDAVGDSNEPPSVEQVDGWLRTVVDMQRTLNDADLIDSTSLAASVHARAFHNAPAPDVATSPGSQFAAAAYASSPNAPAVSTICVETERLEEVTLRARIVAQKQAQLALQASALERHFDEDSSNPDQTPTDTQRRSDIGAAFRQMHQYVREFGYLVATLNESISRLRMTPTSLAPATHESPKDSLPESRNARRRVLVVDDSLIVRTVEEQILESAGYDVSVCGDGEEALDILKQLQFDLVICDVQMPNLDGFGLTSRIRASPTLHHIPVILVTGRSSPDDLMRGAQVGADGYIAKEDLEHEELVLAVQRLLR